MLSYEHVYDKVGVETGSIIIRIIKKDSFIEVGGVLSFVRFRKVTT